MLLVNYLLNLQDLLLEKEQLLRELDMYQEIAVAKGQEYEQLNTRMDHCQANIEKLSDEIQRLQGLESVKVPWNSRGFDST
jgi:predicted  nucleic acid-binding Zn-ribbon protein